MDTLSQFPFVAATGLALFATGFAAKSFVDLARRASSRTRQRAAAQRAFDEKASQSRSELEQKKLADRSWIGNRKFRIERKTLECADICSFYLAPDDGKPLAAFKPGQYLTFDLELPGRQKRMVRCYSLSDGPGRDRYRVTIKRVGSPREKLDAPPGICSSHFHDGLREGDLVEARAPTGNFFLDATAQTPIVLIAGGVGVTPVLSMLKELAERRSKREIWFFLGVRNKSEHPFQEEIGAIAKSCPNLQVHLCYSRPCEGEQCNHRERISIDLLRRVLPSNAFDFYLCGPGQMMESVHRGLKDWGVADERIHLEAFGPASLKKTNHAEPSSHVDVHFAKTGRRITWNGEVESLLDLATAAEIPIDAGCRAGNCGTCRVAVKSGSVRHLGKPGYQLEPGMCLTCCATPTTDIVLDA